MDVRTQGIVLSRKRVADFDVIITVLTKTQGKVRLYVNDARKQRSKFAMVAHPFSVGTFHYKQKEDLSTLQYAELEEAHIALRENFEKLVIGTYMLELIEVSIEDGDHIPRLFDLVAHALTALEGAEGCDVIKNVYTLKVIQRLGFEPSVDHCCLCGTHEDLLPVFSIADGGVACRACVSQLRDPFKLSIDSLKWINVALKSPYATVQALKVSDTMMSTVDGLLNRFVQAHVARRRLKSLDMLNDI